MPDISDIQKARPASSGLPARPGAVLFLELKGAVQGFTYVATGQGADSRGSHKETAASLLTAGGGVVSQTAGDSCSAYFKDTADALKSALRVRSHFITVNTKRSAQDRVLPRIGIHVSGAGPGTSVWSEATNVASRLAAAAEPSQILISPQAYEAARGLSRFFFQPGGIRGATDDGGKGMTVYSVVEGEPGSPEEDRGIVIYFRPIWELGDPSFPVVWNSMVGEDESLWGEGVVKKLLYPEGVLGLTISDGRSVLPVIDTLIGFLGERIGQEIGQAILPVHVFIQAYPSSAGEDPVLQRGELPLEGINSGDILISREAYEHIGQGAEIPVVAEGGPGSIPLWHKVADHGANARGGETKFLYQEALGRGRNEPCFYCGSRRHKATVCPSKHLLEDTSALERLGYLSVKELNGLFSKFLRTETQDPQGFSRELLEGHEKRLNPAFYAFYELNKVFQLRFFRAIWSATGDSWSKAVESKTSGKGGLPWLAQDSLRVSDLVRAESLLKEAQTKYPDDFRIYCTSGYLYVERGDLAEAEYFFKKALKFAKAKTSKIFVHFLLSRLNRLLGRDETSYRNIGDILALDSGCDEAAYLDALFRLRDGNEKGALQRLAVLIAENGKFYVQALIDPDLAPFRDVINEQLITLWGKAREEAEATVREATEHILKSKVLLQEKDFREVAELQTEIDALIQTESYLGYLDVIRRGNAIITICENAVQEQKREAERLLDRLSRRVDKDVAFMAGYSFPRLVSSYHAQLRDIKGRIVGAMNAPPPTTPEEFGACLRSREEITSELLKIEAEFARFEAWRQTLFNALKFIRNSLILMAIVLSAGVFLFPTTVHYLNMILARMDLGSISDVGSYQRYFIVLGGAASLVVSFLLTVRPSQKGAPSASPVPPKKKV